MKVKKAVSGGGPGLPRDVANLWRMTGDVQNTWSSVMGNIHSQNDMAAVAQPGHFNVRVPRGVVLTAVQVSLL